MTAWYQDETSLIAELRDEIRGSAPPSIAGFTDMRELRRGGQGVVYLATQTSTQRRVAVKVLLDHALSDMTRSRFQREIDLIAALQHPGIVRLYDSGMTAEGRPYLVMELIEGVPLHEHIATTRPSPSRIVELYKDITDAVNYAHQRGVIHRDLKPGNIRISPDGKPHVLDFGLAKIVDTPDASHARTLSLSGQFLGSLPWASPEQADGRPQDVDVRSDIYALGVMLYDALAGQMPYDVTGSMRQTLTHILETQPPPPSSFNRAADRDLDTIVLKALSKDPQRRYQSAEAFANDLARYLAGEPIEARRDSTWYVVVKTARKHRLAASVIVGAAVALIGFTIVLGVLYQRAVAGEQLAEQRLELAEREAGRAERRFAEVRDLANRLMFDMHDELADLAGSRPVRELLVTTALSHLESLAEEATDDADLMLELAAAYTRVGDVQGNPHLANLGDTSAAMESYQFALQLRLDALEKRPHDRRIQREVADAINRIGDTHQWQGEHEAAVESYAQAMTLLEDMLEDQPDDAAAQRLLGGTYLKSGDLLQRLNDPDGMLQQYQSALALMQQLAADNPDASRDAMNLAVCHSKVGYAIGYLGDLDAALGHHRAALGIHERIAANDPDNASAKRGVSVNANQVGATLVAMGRMDNAMAYYERSLEIATLLYEADPGNTLAVSDLAFTRNKIGELHMALSEHARAVEQYTQARDLRQVIAARDPGNASFQRDLATSHWLVAYAFQVWADDESLERDVVAERLGAAVASYERCRDVLLEMQQRGTLMPIDQGRAEQLQEEIDALHDRLFNLQ